MQVVEVTRFGGPEVLRPVERPDPDPGPGQVVVRMAAATVNPADIGGREGQVPGPPPVPPFVLGWDLAGEVVAVGDGVTAPRPGDRVVGLVPWFQTRGTVGAYAELVVADAGWLVPLPAGLDYAEAATVPLNALTAHQILEMAALPAGSPVLITGASGGVGTFTVQLAVRAGLDVTAIAGRDGEDWVRQLGAHRVLPRDTDPATVGPLPAVFDLVPLGPPAAAAVADGGVLITTRPTPPVDPARRVQQEVVLIRSDPAALAQLVDDVAAGRLHTRVARTMPLAEAAQAHRLSTTGGQPGKIVLIAA